MIAFLDRSLRKLERLLDFSASIAIGLMMLLIFGEVVTRYAFGFSIVGVYEITEMYLMAAVVFLSVAGSQDRGVHIAIEVFAGRSQGLKSTLMRSVGLVAGLILFSLIGWQSMLMTFEHWQRGMATDGVIELPTWIGWGFVAVGSAVLAVRLGVQLLQLLFGSSEPARKSGHERGEPS